jgi:hypothetical protein
MIVFCSFGSSSTTALVALALRVLMRVFSQLWHCDENVSSSSSNSAQICGSQNANAELRMLEM